MNSQAEKWASDGSLEKVFHNRLDEEERAVDESFMILTLNVKGLSKQNIKN